MAVIHLFPDYNHHVCDTHCNQQHQRHRSSRHTPCDILVRPHHFRNKIVHKSYTLAGRAECHGHGQTFSGIQEEINPLSLFHIIPHIHLPHRMDPSLRLLPAEMDARSDDPPNHPDHAVEFPVHHRDGRSAKKNKNNAIPFWDEGVVMRGTYYLIQPFSLIPHNPTKTIGVEF